MNENSKAGRTFEETKNVAKTRKVLHQANLDPETEGKVVKALEEEKAKVKKVEVKKYKTEMSIPDNDEVKYLYHGSTKENIENIKNIGVDLSKSRKDLDFNSQGRGAFYTSESIKETIKYNKRFKEIITDIVHFKVPKGEFSELNIKVFKEADEEWAKFVTEARRGTLKHDYDIVVGPKLKNPRDINLPNFEAKPITNPMEIQVAFTSQKALDVLNKYIKK